MLKKSMQLVALLIISSYCFTACDSEESHEHKHDGGHQHDEHMGHDDTEDTCEGLTVDMYMDGVTKEAGDYTVSLTASPTPIDAGNSNLTVSLTATDVARISDISAVKITAWMPAHEHGPTPQEQTELELSMENNSLVFEDVDLFMPGCWKIDIELTTGENKDIASFIFSLEG